MPVFAAEERPEARGLHRPGPGSREHTHCLWMSLLLTSGTVTGTFFNEGWDYCATQTELLLS